MTFHGKIGELGKLLCRLHNEVVNLVCLDKDCQTAGVICGVCQHQSHKTHNVKSIKFVLNKLTEQAKSSQKLIMFTAQIDKNINELLQKTNKISNQQQKNQLRKAIYHYRKELFQKIQRESSTGEALSQIEISVNGLNEFIKKHEFYETDPQNEEEKNLSNIERYLVKIVQELNNKNNDLQTMIKDKSELKDILSLFVLVDSQPKVNYFFSQQFHHTAIKVIDKNKVSQVHNYSANFALIQPIIQGKRKALNKKTLKLKIDKLMSWICIGICYKNIIQAANYYFNTDDCGHGAFMISNDGYSWHHTDSSLQSFYHQWNFVQGDVLILTIDPKKKVLKYEKQNSDKQAHELPYQVVAGDQLCFCVTLNSHDESVSIAQ